MKMKFTLLSLALLIWGTCKTQYISIYQFNDNGTHRVRTPDEIRSLQQQNNNQYHSTYTSPSAPKSNYTPKQPYGLWTDYSSNYADNSPRPDDSIFTSNGKMGVINGNTIIIEPVYDKIEKFTCNLLKLYKNGQSAIAGISGILLSDFGDAATTGAYITGWGYGPAIKVVKNGKTGFVDCNGDYSIPCIYDKIMPFVKSSAFAQYNGKWGIINNKNEIKVPFTYSNIEPVKPVDLNGNEDYSQVVVTGADGKQALITINPYADTLTADTARLNIMSAVAVGKGLDYKNGRTITKRNGKWGCVRVDGKVLLPFVYDSLYDNYFDADSYEAEQNGKWGLVSYTGKVLVPVIYDKFGTRGLGANYVIDVKKNGKYGVIKPDGSPFIPVVCDTMITVMKDYRPSFFIVKQNGKWGFAGDSEQVKISCPYDSLIYYIYNYITIIKGKRGLVSEYGHEILPCIYDDAVSQSHENNKTFWIAKVRLGKKEQYITRTGERAPRSAHPVYDWNFIGAVIARGEAPLPVIYR